MRQMSEARFVAHRRHTPGACDKCGRLFARGVRVSSPRSPVHFSNSKLNGLDCFGECGVLQTCSRHPVYGTGSIVPEPQLRLSAVGYVQSYDRCSPDGDGKDSATPSLCQQVVRTYEFYSAGGRVYGEMACRSFGCCRLGRREHLVRSHNSGEYAVVIGSLRCGGLAEYRSDASALHPAGQAITTSTAARRWAGFIFSPFSELHTFRLASTDGVRLRLPAQTPMRRAEAHDRQSAI